jgi:hypothetical protein
MTRKPNSQDSLLSAVARTLGHAAGKFATITHVAGNDDTGDNTKKESSTGRSPRVRKLRPHRAKKSAFAKRRMRPGSPTASASSARKPAKKRVDSKSKNKARKR